MNTNRATAYSPEAIANREAEGMVICRDCLTEHYASEPHTCPGRMLYFENYAAAPEIENWREYTSDELDALKDEIAATRDAAYAAGGVHISNWQSDMDGAERAIEESNCARAIMVARDEDGVYFAILA